MIHCFCLIFRFCRHQQYLGKVKQAVFHTPKAGRRLVVSTEESVIASLDLRRGEICKYNFHFWFKFIVLCINLLVGRRALILLLVLEVWRHVLGEKDPIDHIDITLGKCKLIFIVFDLLSMIFIIVLLLLVIRLYKLEFWLGIWSFNVDYIDVYDVVLAF